MHHHHHHHHHTKSQLYPQIQLKQHKHPHKTFILRHSRTWTLSAELHRLEIDSLRLLKSPLWLQAIDVDRRRVVDDRSKAFGLRIDRAKLVCKPAWPEASQSSRQALLYLSNEGKDRARARAPYLLNRSFAYTPIHCVPLV